MTAYQEKQWGEWLINVSARQPRDNKLLESSRGQEVVKIFIEENKRAFNWRRDDYDTFWIDVQMATLYGFDDSEIRFLLRTQMGLDHYKAHKPERDAYAEMMRGLDKLKKINFPEIYTHENSEEKQKRLFDSEMFKKITPKIENGLYGSELSWKNGDYGYQVKRSNGTVLNENLDKS